MKRALFATVALAALGLSACQTQPPTRVQTSGGGKSAALRSMEQVGRAAYQCWFASKDPAFRGYSFANELNSMSGAPRFLLVPRRNFGGRPLLVVQARGNSSRVESFGPLLEEPLGRRINEDIARWAGGSTSCGASA
jgi:hypothetical protein